MSQNTNNAIQSSLSSSSGSGTSGGGDQHGGSVSAASVVASGDDWKVSVGGGYTGSWSSTDNSLYSVGAGISWSLK